LIGVKAFRGTALRRVTIPSNVEVIGEVCFSGCGKLSEVRFEEGPRLVRIGDGVFDSTGITKIEIPSGVQVVERGALGPALESVESGEDVPAADAPDVDE
jgi:hypothetical protein